MVLINKPHTQKQFYTFVNSIACRLWHQVFVPYFSGFVSVIFMAGMIIFYPLYINLPGPSFGPILEEVVKVGMAVFLVYRGMNPWGILIIALGFGYGEQYINSSSYNMYLRIPWMHLLVDIPAAIFIKKYFATQRKVLKVTYLILALIIPIILHLSYNFYSIHKGAS